jgi:hypothetical protein
MKFVIIGGSGLIEQGSSKDFGRQATRSSLHRPRSDVKSITGEGLFSRRCFVWPIGADQTSAGFCQGDA